METKNVYEDIVYLTFNIFKNEKTRTMIKMDNAFEEKVLILINDILLLEKDFEASWAEKTWFSEYAKTLVNIVQKKLKFEKVDNKKVDETYKDYSDLIVYITKNFEIKRDEVVSKVNRPNYEDLKFYQVVTSEMMGRYKLKEEPEVEVMNDNSKIKADTSTGGGANSNAGAGFTGGAAGPNPFMGGGIPQNPMMDDKFYPYRTKPKYVRPLRLFIGISAIFFALSTLLVYILAVTTSATIALKDILNTVGLTVDDSNYQEGMSINTVISIGVTAGAKGLQFYMSTFFILIYVAAVCWAAYRMMRPAKGFRDYYTTPTMTYVLVLIVVVLIFAYNFYDYNVFLGFDRDTQIKNIIKSLNNEKGWGGSIFKNGDEGALSLKYILSKFQPNNPDLINLFKEKAFTDSFMQHMTGFKAVLGIFVATFGVTLIAIITSWVLNPRLDRNKLLKMQMEMQMQMQYAMQGQSYEIDPSLYTPNDEYEAVMKKIRERSEKKSKSKNLD